jgi:hypothetical protein
VSRAESPLRGRVVFLVGARRSGTNWLERILAVHPAITAMPPETYLFSHGIAPLAERVQHANPSSPMMGKTFMHRDGFLDAVRDLVDRAFLDNIDADTRFLVERTPWHAQHLDLIARVYPDARVLHIVRDGRDVARSLLSMTWGPRAMGEAAREWRDTVAGGRSGAALFGDRYHEVRYERALRAPQEEVERLYDWLGLELPEDLLERILLESRSEFNVDPARPQVGADKWRAQLSPRQVAEFERVAGEQLEALGYPRSGLPSHPGGLGRLRPRAPGASTSPRALLRRAAARRARGELERHHAIAARFEELLEDGDDEGALALTSPKVRVRVAGDVDEQRGRGEQAARALVAAVAEHRDTGRRILSGATHVSHGQFTAVTTYAINDGTRWSRVLVLTVEGEQIAEASLYRFALES